ncbi:MAG: hypothetical protein PHW60_11860, partial [Kiritimatiellae bacterium]|nr:hypothetical protein [Kiritimatiellia bacterium]
MALDHCRRLARERSGVEQKALGPGRRLVDAEFVGLRPGPDADIGIDIPGVLRRVKDFDAAAVADDPLEQDGQPGIVL